MQKIESIFLIGMLNKELKFNDIMKNPGKVPYIDKSQKIKYDTAPKAPMPKGNFVEINKMLGR